MMYRYNRISAKLLSSQSSLVSLYLREIRRNVSKDSSKPFDKILIANRGEIACRIMRTAKRLNVKTVAVYSDADASAMHVRMADEAYHIGGSYSKDSYLCMDKILDIAKKTGAQGIHPGYGFLSENSKFADLVEASGISFIGPSSAPMNAMGDKINSKKIAKDAGCFVIPGYQGEVENEERASQIAKEVGYPVMIKASAGGGGKGMRVAYNDAEVREGFRLSKAEALSSFGDDRMLIERFIEDPHHIEIQVLADTHGNVVAFPERECSVQRRNQKVVEESPSCLLTPATRRLMQEQAILLCKATGYRSAGTVEMLCDGKQNFYFLEMNTRLQVEHPITELVSGEDLVEHMLWIAAGKPLPSRLVKQTCLPFKGWAIESRVYAEDPLRNFLPSIGPLNTYKEPELFSSPSSTVRIDTGVYEGGVISMYYDPMISKLCTHANTRNEAIQLMENALDNYVVFGLGNNIPFLRSVYRNKNFRSGNYGTKFIGQEYPDGFKGVELSPLDTNRLIATTALMHSQRMRQSEPFDEDDDVEIHDEAIVTLNTSNKSYEVTVTTDENEDYVVHIKPLTSSKSETITVSSFDWDGGDPLAYVSFKDTSSSSSPEISVQFEGRQLNTYNMRYFGSQQSITVLTPREHVLSKYMLEPEKKDVSKFLMCPMPGTLISCSVQAGQAVEMGQQLVVVEAMKMQNVLRATKAGIIKEIKCKPGSHLKVDQVILEFQSS